MAQPGTIRYAPANIAVGTSVVISAVGSPAFSFYLLIAAPQRVPVPHVVVKRTPDMPRAFSSRAILLPIFLAVSMEFPAPVVV